MKLNTPLVTLLGGAALGVGVLVASVVTLPSTASAGAGATSAASSSAPGTAGPAGTKGTAPTATSAPATTPATAPATAPATTPTTAPATTPTTAPATAPAATSSAYPAQADYVAMVNGGGAAVAISVHQGKAVAYVCNGHAVAAWYRGTAVNGKLNLTGKNGATLTVDYHPGQAAGSVMADGVRYTFSAPLVHRVSSALRPPGLYEATSVVHGVSIRAGWIVLPNGGQIGSVEYDPDSSVPPTAQAPLLDLATGTAQYDGITFVASLISGLTGSGF